MGLVEEGTCRIKESLGAIFLELGDTVLPSILPQRQGKSKVNNWAFMRRM
jgi:hypothetical protein